MQAFVFAKFAAILPVVGLRRSVCGFDHLSSLDRPVVDLSAHDDERRLDCGVDRRRIEDRAAAASSMRGEI